MPAAPSEPEKYSIDEMMDRLKANPSEDPTKGELVTRSDGSQAIRVRKRKRRSTQPQKERAVRDRRVRIVQISAAFLLVLVAALVVGAGIIYANSKPFRDKLVDNIARTSGATPDLQTFRMNPQTSNSGGLTLTWPTGNVLDTLKLRTLVAEISPASFLGKTFFGDDVTISESSLRIRLPQPGAKLRAVPAPSGPPPIHFKHYRTSNFSLELAGQDTTVLRLARSEASFSMDTVNGTPRLSLFRGDLGIPGWPKFRLDRAFVEMRGKEIEIIDMGLHDESDDSGSLNLSGTISPYQPNLVSNLAISLHAFPLSGLLGPTFGNLISGRIDTEPSAKSNYLSFKATHDSEPAMEIAFASSAGSGIEIRRFPFLVTLSQMLDEDAWYEKPLFDSDAKGVIHHQNGNTSLRDLNLQSKGRMTLRGDLAMTGNQALSGNLRVGLPESMIPKSSALRKMLSPAEDGFRWISLKISGTTAAPVDNFQDLITRSGQPALETPTPARDNGSSFDELTHPER